MPKDPRRSVDQYKISGSHLNEFEFHQHQEELSEHHDKDRSHLIPGTPPQLQAQRVQQVMKKAQQLAKKKAKRQAAAPTKSLSSSKSLQRSAKKSSRKTKKAPGK